MDQLTSGGHMRILEIDHLRKRYSGRRGAPEVVALDDVSLSLSRGEVLAVLGLNGAGKTTLVKTICGLLDPDAGTVTFREEISGECRGRIGAVFEGNRNVYWRLTARENLEYFGALRGLSLRHARKRAAEMLEQFNLGEKRSVIAARLSRGMQQRLALAISMIHDPALLVLDEPTLGVDLENVIEIVSHLGSLSARGVSIVLTSHQMDFVKMVADTVGVLSRGRLVALESVTGFASRVVGDSYSMQLLEDIDRERGERLRGLGVADRDGQLHFGVDRLYDVLEIVKPLRIGKLNRAGADLVTAFLDQVRETSHA